MYIVRSFRISIRHSIAVPDPETSGESIADSIDPPVLPSTTQGTTLRSQTHEGGGGILTVQIMKMLLHTVPSKYRYLHNFKVC